VHDLSEVQRYVDFLGERNSAAPTPYRLTYLDEDGDVITISHEEEFQEAANLFINLQAPFKLVATGFGSAQDVLPRVSSL